ncbi:phosphoglycerate dehydrogenase [Roseospira visakhapatnamensis]|uniref:D-3-phosphoglycerate dehydrogenase n=1 Tax=Roseospira visakhapatnamensis TaxID=390880 RepID=A0A7W6RBY5_9PROT|nr:phosphoglycerate dehydrogenase [Roseospira visakhapatnamensis]MBB4265598.1 D-3-phosphoglycerate dehydrogenase [Roseospira visakhapatnamensis]
MPKVLVSDKLSPTAVEIFRERGITADVKTGLTPEELIAIIGEYDGLAIRSATKVTKAVLAAASNLKVIGRAGIGVDNVDVPAATQSGVVVMNTPYGNAITTAEHAIAMMFAQARQIPQANASTHAGKWEKSKFMGVELSGKVLGIIGCGNIGSIVAERAIGLRMRVIAYDPFLSPERATDLGVEKVDLDDLIQRADIITLHTPLTDKTRGILNADAIARMKKGVRIVNCARGGLVDEAALKAALESGHVAGAALDVFAEEPARDNPLFGMDTVVCTPHLGASTSEAQENVALQVAEQISDFLLTGAVTNALNTAAVSAEDAPRLRPYMKLCAQLGSFAGQITESGLKSVHIEYQGDVAGLNTRPLTSVVLQGLLSPLLDSVNMVNAQVIARDRDVEVKETKSESCRNYHSLIRLEVTTERQTRSVEGSLFGDALPRVVRINDIPVEAELAPDMLYTINEDKPGFIGRLGSTIGDAGLNIASFHLGRASVGGQAICLVQVDSAVSPEVLATLCGLPHVLMAKALRF